MLDIPAYSSVRFPQISKAIAQAETKYRADIDGLRAFAVLAVVAFHAFPNFIRAGFIGVDVFFVISGYLISTIILQHLVEGNFSFTDFYYRRIKRIFPSLLLVLLFTGLFGWYVLMSDEYSQLGQQISGGAGFVSNILQWKNSGYFDSSSSTKPLLHLWSLGIEEQFYMIWPLLLYGAYRKKYNLFIVITAITLVSFVLNVALVTSDPVGTYYLPFTRFWELGIGAILAYLQVNKIIAYEVQSSPLSNLISFLGFALLGISLININSGSAFPGWWALIPTLGTMCVIVGGRRSWVNKEILSNPVVVWFGLISYPLYLWHWTLLSYLNIIVGPRPPHELRLLMILLSVLLAWLSYEFVEKKLRFNRSAWVIPSLIAGCLATIFMGAIISHDVVKSRLNSPALDKLLMAVNDWGYPPKDFSRFRYDSNDYYIMRTGAKKVLFIGDSNMEQYGVRIEKVLSEQPLKTRTAIFATTGSCPPILNVFVNDQPACQPRLKSAYKLALSPDIDSVVIGGCWYCYFVVAVNSDGDKDYSYEANGVRSHFRNGKGAELALLEFEKNLREVASKKKVYLVLNAPAGPTLDPRYSSQGARLSSSLDFKLPDSLALNQYTIEYGPTRDALVAIALRAGATVIDPLDFLCKGNICPSVTADGKPIYKDSTHIRADYSRNHVAYLDATVLANVE